MTRFLLLVLALTWVARFLSRLKLSQGSHFSPPSPGLGPSSGRPIEALTRCESCGAYFPAASGLGPAGRFCSTRCQDGPH